MADRKLHWPSHLFGGRLRTSTLALIVAFAVLTWLHQTYEPAPQPPEPAPQIVPPGFVPDPNYTWVPRTNVRRTTEAPDPTTTTTSPTSPTESTPSTTVVDPDGPGPLSPEPQTETVPTTPTTPETLGPAAPGETPTTTTAPPS